MAHESHIENEVRLPTPQDFKESKEHYGDRSDTLRSANKRFHREYEDCLSEIRDRIGTEFPAIVIANNKIVTLWRDDRDEQVGLPPIYHKLKSIAHQVVATFLLAKRSVEKNLSGLDRAALLERHAALESSLYELEQPEYEEVCTAETKLLIAASLEFVYGALKSGRISKSLLNEWAKQVGPVLTALTNVPAQAQLTLLHSHVMRLREKMSMDEWADLHVVIAGSRQARAGDVSCQYFSKLFGEQVGVGASQEDKILYVEGVTSEEELLKTLAKHILDGEMGEAFFGSRFRLQRDILADSAAEYIDDLLADMN